MNGESLPKVSIIIPAYNVAPFIGETLDSVFAQTYKDFETIVINDGSPDTEEFERMLRPYLNRVKYLKQENRGASVARNAGIRTAQGELIAFLDADDIWLPSYLEEQVRFIRESGSDLVCADAVHFGGSVFDGRTYAETLMPDFPDTGKVTFLGLLNGEHHLITSGVVASRKSILEVGLFDESLRNAQDFDLWLRLARHGAQLSYQRRVLLRYRYHENSLSGDEINRNARELRVYDKIERSYNLSPPEQSAALSAIQKRRSLLEFELGKLYLMKADFARARDSFALAKAHHSTIKVSVAALLVRTVPNWFRAVYLHRTRASRQRPAMPANPSFRVK